MMTESDFPFEDCLLKHHIRRNAWLPVCKERLRLLRKGRPPAQQRRLRYFTFCAVGAIDVLMLEQAQVVRKSTVDRRLDTVYFFHRSRELVDSTTKRIPGAIGFPGDFVAIVHADDREEEDAAAALESPSTDPDTHGTREKQLALSTRRSFVASFPFDVVNLDLEGFFFKRSDPLPGRLANAMRRVFEWQRRPLRGPGTRTETLDGFSLMFTTQIGPANLGDDYLEMLRRYLRSNLDRQPALADHMEQSTGIREIDRLEGADFDAFFRLAAPKLLSSILNEEDWHIDDAGGIQLFELSRESSSGSYKMLHMVMQVRRKVPPRELRAPGTDSATAIAAYEKVTERLFRDGATLVTDAIIDQQALRTDLEAIKAFRRKIYPEGES